MQAAFFRSLQRGAQGSPLAANIGKMAEGLGLWFPHIKERKQPRAAKGEFGRGRAKGNKERTKGKSGQKGKTERDLGKEESKKFGKPKEGAESFDS